MVPESTEAAKPSSWILQVFETETEMFLFL